MSNSVFQSVIVQLKEIPDRVFGVIDSEGGVISCTDVSYIGERWADAALKITGSGDSMVTFGQKTFKAILSTPCSAPVTMRPPALCAPWPLSP